MYQVLINEYKSLVERSRYLEKQINTLPLGYLSTKKINGKTYHYYQRRVHNKIVSKYIAADDVDSVALQIELRKSYQVELKDISKKRKQLEAIAYKLNRRLVSYFHLLEAEIGMDSLSRKERYESISFADAMTAIEGVPASAETDKELILWAESKQTYHDTCIHILKQCGVMLEVE